MVKKIKPITRENLLELIRRNGGSAYGLDLSRRTFETAIDLSGMDLGGIILDEANLSGSYPPDLNFKGEFLDGRDARTLGAILVGAKSITASLRRAMLSFVNFESADLSDADLREAYLNHACLRKATLEQCNFTEARLQWADLGEANLRFSNLRKAELSNANLMSSDLLEANLEGAHLFEAELSGANLTEANLSGANMTGVKFDSDTELTSVKWGNYILGEEKIGHFEEAADTYRRLKQWYTNAGLYNVAGEFFFREMTAKRKSMEWSPNPFPRIFSKLLSILCGYGENYIRVILSAIIVLVLVATIYWLFGGLNFLDALYFSAVSFTALGYGGWVNAPPQDWVKGIGVFESFVGVFMMALWSEPLRLDT